MKKVLYFCFVLSLVACVKFSIEDNEPPVVVLAGDSEIVLSPGSDFVEPGYLALDNLDGDISSRVVVKGGNFTTDKPGVYDISYVVYNRFGVASEPVSRRVIIRELSSRIELEGDAVIYLAVGQRFLEPGFTAFDVKGDDASGDVIWNSLNVVDTTRPGSYLCKYSLKDKYGYSCSAYRRVIVSLPEQPIILLKGLGQKENAPFNIEIFSTALNIQKLDPGYSALDKSHGDITAKVVVDYSSIITDESSLGLIQQLVYKVEEEGEVVAHQTRFVRVVFDATPPEITIIGSLAKSFELGVGVYVEEGANAIDQGVPCPVEISINKMEESQVVLPDVSISFMEKNPGLYHVVYKSQDSIGNLAEAVRTVLVVDTILPVLSFDGGVVSQITTKTQNLVFAADMLEILEDPTFVDNDEGCILVVQGNSRSEIDTRRAGSYSTSFYAVDRSGNRSFLVRRNVNILPPPVPNLVNGSFEDFIPDVGRVNEATSTYEGWYWDMRVLNHYSLVTIDDVGTVLSNVLFGVENFEDSWDGPISIDGAPQTTTRAGYSTPYCGIGVDGDSYYSATYDGIGAAWIVGAYLSTPETRIDRVNLKEIGYVLNITMYNVLFQGAKYYRRAQGSLKQDGIVVKKDVTYRLSARARYALTGGGQNSQIKFQVVPATEGMRLNGAPATLSYDFHTIQHPAETYCPVNIVFTPDRDGYINLDFYKDGYGNDWGFHAWIDSVSIVPIDYPKKENL